MSSVPKKQPASKPLERRLRWLMREPGNRYGVIRLALTYRNRTELYEYFLKRIPADWGLGVELTKLGEGQAEVYHVMVVNEQDHSCDCPGFTYHSHCKHADAIRALVAKGDIR